MKASTLKGFRDLLPDQMLKRRKIIDTIWSKALQSGYLPIETPTLEYAETLLGTGNQETDKEIYLFEDHGKRKVGMRFDLTVPFARFVAENQGKLVMPFKKVQIGQSWRGEKPQKGRYREFYQADLDIVGIDSAAADIEVISSLITSMKSLIPSQFRVYLGNRLILSAILKAVFPNLNETDEKACLVALDKWAKIGVDKVKEQINALESTNEDSSQRLIELLEAKAENGDTDLNALETLLKQNDQIQEQLKRLETTASILRQLHPDSQVAITVDLRIARGLGYYTGIVFETFIEALPGFGSVSSGGRYNDLVSRFSKQSLPGIGGSIGVDRLLAALEELDTVSEPSRSGVFIAIATQDALEYGFKLASLLREEINQTVDVGLNLSKIANQFRYADKRGFAKVVVVGDEEKASSIYTLKDLSSGEETRNLSLDELKKSLTLGL